MKTRSQSKKENHIVKEVPQLYEVNIDFDEASEAWRANKKSIGNGSYKYLCAKISKNNNCCPNKCLHGEDYCKTHLKMFNECKI
jgi:hypothetical protein